MFDRGARGVVRGCLDVWFACVRIVRHGIVRWGQIGIGRLDRLVVRRSLRLADERLRRVLHLSGELPHLAQDLGELFGTEEQEGGGAEQRHVGD